MFHGAHLRMRRGNQPSTFHSFFGSVYTGNKQPFRRGIMFVFIAGVLILVGGILTWLGYSNVFGNSRISTMGPLLIALALLMFLIAIRQFLLAKKQTLHNRGRLEQLAGGTVAAVVINSDEMDDTVTVIMDTLNDSPEVCRPHGESQPPSYQEATDTPVILLAPSAPDYHSDPPPSYEEAITDSVPGIGGSVPVIK
ncbi:uncharacterized protein LOC110462808 [Mizuhopecten yessoensis]|uniref:uncharacterized protein LOC110462808 n=1 Tax=Mizuhopecten yessoensis TaxID=6573 RepID=UPI000B45BB72|nr:uncharacterized protein LOC110462808 [Mizuhopecten yessoensis]XP_021372675.1 uncharacterized protein LOC110462808 [Mizuhopecten yessoensis]